MVHQKSGKYKAWKWIAGILGGIILISIVIALYLVATWKPKITEKLKSGVYNKSMHLYKLDFEDISLNLLTGSAELYKVSLTPDTVVYNQLKALNVAPANIFQVKLERLQLNRLGLLTAYFKRKIDMKAIVLEQPSINMIHYKVKKHPDTATNTPTLYEMLGGRLKSIDVQAIRIINADFDYINGENAKKIHSIKHLNINIKDFLVDSLAASDTTRFYNAKDISFELTGYKSVGKDKMYTTKVDTIRGSTAEKKVVLKKIQMIPMYPELAFTRKYTFGKDRYDLLFNQLILTGLDFNKFDDDEAIHVEALTIGPAKVNIFVNRELPAPPDLDKVRNFPHMALKRLSIPTTIDTIKLKQIDVAYTEYNPISQKSGTVYFQNLSGNIRNVTNDSVQLAKNNHAIANLTALVMKTSKINIHINFNLTDKNAAFSYKGNVAAMDMTILNPVAKNMGLVEIESGKMQKTDFDIQANAQGASGTVHFYYSALKVKLLKEGEDGMAPKKKGLLSFLANALLIKDANPTKGEAARTANVSFERTPAASFFNLLWKGVFIGMRETIGLGIIPVKTPEQGMKKVESKKEERQEKRKEKREERKKEREKRKKDQQQKP